MFPKIGFSTNVFDNPADIIDSVQRVAGDFSFVELELGDAAERTVYDATPEQYKNLVSALKMVVARHELTLSLHAPYVGVTGNLASLDESRRRQSIDRLKKSIVFAHDIGSTIVTCHPGLRMRQTNETLLPILFASLKEVAAFAKDFGIQLSVENMGSERPNYLVMTPGEQIQMCQETGVSITLDLIHLASVEPNLTSLENSLDRLAPFIINMHIADMILPKHIHIPIGEGNLPLEKLLRRLGDNGYRGAAIVEEFGGPYDTDTFYRHARAFRHYFENQEESAVQGSLAL
jgi:sugar phosphate isomerase/epimerase